MARSWLCRVRVKRGEIGSLSLEKKAFIFMYKLSGHRRYFSEKRRYCVVLQRYWVDFRRKGAARLGRCTNGSFVPREELGWYEVAIGRDFVNYERILAYFSTRNLHKKSDMVTARCGRPTRASTKLRVPISLRIYWETAKFLQEFLIGMLIGNSDNGILLNSGSVYFFWHRNVELNYQSQFRISAHRA